MNLHEDWMQELEEHRKPERVVLTEEQKAPIIEFIKMARKDNGKGVVSFKKLSELIEKRFGHKVASSRLTEWIK